MKWIQNLWQDVKAYIVAQKEPYPDPKNKYYPKIKVKSFGGNLKLTEEKHGIW